MNLLIETLNLFRVITKWKALAFKAKSQKGAFKPGDEEDEEYKKIEQMIKGPSGSAAKSHSLAQASVASFGGGAGSPKRTKKKFSKIMAASDDPNDKWKTTIKKLVSKAQEEQDEESAKRLALIKDARRAKASISTDMDQSDNFGRQKSKKSSKWQDALPLVPIHLKKKIVGGKEHKDADLAFYRAFKYIFVDIPEAEEDFPSESPNRKTHCHNHHNNV